MKRLRLLAVMLLLGGLTFDYERGFYITAAYAQAGGTLTISWSPPTEYTDGFPLLEQDMDFYTFSCNGSQLKVIDLVVGTYSDIVDVSGLSSGSYTCHLTITSLEAVESGPSNTINFTINARTPGSPAGLTTS
jgi:hypothetical protein